MTPKETAIQLLNNFNSMNSWCDDAKECARVTISEILKVYDKSNKNNYIPVNWDVKSYYKKVVEELEKL
jgi:hypothetical protein